MKPNLAIAAIGVFMFTCGQAFMPLKDFQDTIQPLCTGRMTLDNRKELPNGQELPIPNTIESFIGLVSKLEQKHADWRPIEMIKILLLNFRYDDAEIKLNSIKSRGKVKEYYEILLELFRNPSVGQRINDDDLSRDERCALFNMISRTVNSTYRLNEDELLDQSLKDVPKMLREQGVVTLSQQTGHAFALGKVLLGLLAGLETNVKAEASKIYNGVKKTNTAPDYLDNIVLDVLYGVTFGDVISVTKLQIDNLNPQINKELLFHLNGMWDETVCPLHYFLENDRKMRHATYSLIRGATDGYRLGIGIKDIMKNYPKLRLSQILRMYYGNGFPSDRALSWCDRRALTFNLLREEAINFDKLLSALLDSKDDDEIIKRDIDSIFSTMDSDRSAIYDEAYREGNKCGGTEMAACETPMHLLAVMDYRGSQEIRNVQSELIGNLTSGMQFSGPRTSAVSVFTNLKPSSGVDMDNAINDTYTSGCGGCAAKYYETMRGSFENEIEVFRDLNVTLGKFTEEMEEHGAPSNVVLYFNYGNIGYDRALDNAVGEIKWRYRGAKVIVVGTRKDMLKSILKADDSDIETDMNTSPISPMKLQRLKEKTCKVPALFQYRNCYQGDEASERGERYEGVISPRGVQYWMMEPKYFLKSFNIKLTFKSLNGEIRVCFTRDYYKMFNNKEPTEADCQKLTSGEEYSFQVKDPCYRRHLGNCDPFYFYIEGRGTPKDNELCQDDECLTLDHLQFEFTHRGVSCNGASLLSIGKFWFFTILAVAMWAFRSR